MSQLEATSPFLAIPLELREKIYKEVLSHKSHGSALLRTCREIYTESHKYLFQRPLLFRSQSTLCEWLERVPPKHLSHICELNLELQEVDLKPLLTPLINKARANTTPRLLAWELHEKDLGRLRQALSKLPNVKSLTACAQPDRPSYLYRDFLADFLDLLGALWPGLQELSLEGNFHHQSLSFLSALTQLKAFSFDGFSSSASNETADILLGLQHLESVSLVPRQGLLTPIIRLPSGLASKRQAFTSTVLRAMDSLASFTVTECIQPASSPALFFTPEMLSSLHNHSTLKSLTIRLSQAPESDAVEALDAFLEKSSIEYLELDWPGLDRESLHTYFLLPTCLKHFRVRVPSTTVAFDVLNVVLESREAGHMPALREVVLVRTNWKIQSDEAVGKDKRHDSMEKVTIAGGKIDGGYAHASEPTDNNNDLSTNATDKKNIANAITLLGNLGVKALWYTEPA